MTRWTSSVLMAIFALGVSRSESASAPRSTGRQRPASFTAARVLTASSPDNNYSVLLDFIESTSRYLLISVYQLDNASLGDAIGRALARGVKVRIYAEGLPIPKVPQAELYIARELVKKGAKVYFYAGAEGRKNRRFKYLHAKYAVSDGKKVIIGSANYGNNGHPIDSSFGNREWEVVLDDPKAAQVFEKVFRNDIGVTQEWAAYGSTPLYTLADPTFKPNRKSTAGSYKLRLKPFEDHEVKVRTIFAPDNSLEKNGAFLGALSAAKSSVDVEQLNFETYWGDKPYNPNPENSPLMDIVLKLARAGKAVRILLNDDMVFREPKHMTILDMAWAAQGDEQGLVSLKAKRDNVATKKYLMKIAGKESLDLEVRLLDYRNCGLLVVHNKGMIIDKNTTLVSSLNWGESALKFNREAGVLMQSPGVAQYYGRAFEYDWRCSERN